MPRGGYGARDAVGNPVEGHRLGWPETDLPGRLAHGGLFGHRRHRGRVRYDTAGSPNVGRWPRARAEERQERAVADQTATGHTMVHSRRSCGDDRSPASFDAVGLRGRRRPTRCADVRRGGPRRPGLTHGLCVRPTVAPTGPPRASG
jgi:hypothetical protein